MKYLNRLRVVLWSLLYCVCAATSYAQQSSKVTFLWVDPLLNARQIFSRSDISNILDKVSQAGIGVVALGVKCNSGEVIYNSQVAPKLVRWEDYLIPSDIDPVQIFLEEGKRRQLQIYAVFPVFAEGHILERQGPVYGEKESWQTQVYVIENDQPVVEPMSRWAQGSFVYANPLKKEVQDYEVRLIKEFVSTYSVDGLILDKVQFMGLESDFSEESKIQFQSAMALNDIQWWPEDVFEWKKEAEEWEPSPGPLFDEWILFRAKSMRSYIQRLVQEVQEIDGTLPIGISVGAWYPTYHEYGVNWASETYATTGSWATQEYYDSGIAELLNYVIADSYFPRIGIDESENIGAEWWMSVEGSAVNAMEVVSNACPVYSSILVPLFSNDAKRFEQAAAIALEQTNGLCLYDVSYIQRFDYWDEIAALLRGAQSKQLLRDF